MNAVVLMRGLLWVAYILYVACFLPQVVTNYRRQSTDGLSNATIFIYFFGYLVEILYAFFLDLPIALKVMIPMGAGVAGTLVIQRLYYDPQPEYRVRTMAAYGLVLIAFLIGVWAGQHHPHFVGHLCGWVGSLCWFAYQVPQVYKVHTRRSVKGFNFWFILIASIGAFIEVAAAIIIPLPAQGLFNGTRGLFFNLILTLQFYRYHSGPIRNWFAIE